MPNEGTALAFWEKFAYEANKIASILYEKERKKFLKHFLLQLIAEIQKHIDTRPSQRVDKSIIGQIYFNDFFFEHGHVITIKEALERVPDAVFALPGSGGLQRSHFSNLSKLAQEALKRELEARVAQPLKAGPQPNQQQYRSQPRCLVYLR